MLGLITAIAYRFERDELRRECPQCGRVTKIYDALCTRCGAELEFPDVAIAPESWEPAQDPDVLPTLEARFAGAVGMTFRTCFAETIEIREPEVGDRL